MRRASASVHYCNVIFSIIAGLVIPALSPGRVWNRNAN
jgi:hypothetical protein